MPVQYLAVELPDISKANGAANQQAALDALATAGWSLVVATGRLAYLVQDIAPLAEEKADGRVSRSRVTRLGVQRGPGRHSGGARSASV
jgi:hypothetical protein